MPKLASSGYFRFHMRHATNASPVCALYRVSGTRGFLSPDRYLVEGREAYVSPPAGRRCSGLVPRFMRANYFHTLLLGLYWSVRWFKADNHVAGCARGLFIRQFGAISTSLPRNLQVRCCTQAKSSIWEYLAHSICRWDVVGTPCATGGDLSIVRRSCRPAAGRIPFPRHWIV